MIPEARLQEIETTAHFKATVDIDDVSDLIAEIRRLRQFVLARGLERSFANWAHNYEEERNE